MENHFGYFSIDSMYPCEFYTKHVSRRRDIFARTLHSKIMHFHTSMRFSDTRFEGEFSRRTEDSLNRVRRVYMPVCERVGEGLYTITSTHQRAGVIIDGLVSRVRRD